MTEVNSTVYMKVKKARVLIRAPFRIILLTLLFGSVHFVPLSVKARAP